MAEAEKVTLFREFDENGFRIRVHTVTVDDSACFVLQAADIKSGLVVHEEVCPPFKHDPSLFIHEDDLLVLEERTEEVMRHLPAERRRLERDRGRRGRNRSTELLSELVAHLRSR